jgi:hypothetical protein
MKPSTMSLAESIRSLCRRVIPTRMIIGLSNCWLDLIRPGIVVTATPVRFACCQPHPYAGSNRPLPKWHAFERSPVGFPPDLIIVVSRRTG